MSRLDAGRQTVSLGTVDLTRLLDDLANLFRLRANVEHLSFEVQRAPDVPAHVSIDAGKLRQVLINLVGNAIKFTKRGGVLVRISFRPSADGPAWFVAEVEDTGPGIGNDEIAGLFLPFAQTRAGARAPGGTGLGLAISRELAKLMGGDIAVRSQVDKGSVFTLEVPVHALDESRDSVATPVETAPSVAGAGAARPPLELPPPPLCAALRHAAHIADYGRLIELLDGLAPEYAPAATALRRLGERFDYDEIERVATGTEAGGCP